MYFSYVLISEKNKILYKGSTENLEKRIIEHNNGLVKYTSKHLPWKLLLFEEFETRAQAMKREKWYKTGAGRDWIKRESGLVAQSAAAEASDLPRQKG